MISIIVFIISCLLERMICVAKEIKVNIWQSYLTYKERSNGYTSPARGTLSIEGDGILVKETFPKQSKSTIPFSEIISFRRTQSHHFFLYCNRYNKEFIRVFEYSGPSRSVESDLNRFFEELNKHLSTPMEGDVVTVRQATPEEKRFEETGLSNATKERKGRNIRDLIIVLLIIAAIVFGIIKVVSLPSGVKTDREKAKEIIENDDTLKDWINK